MEEGDGIGVQEDGREEPWLLHSVGVVDGCIEVGDCDFAIHYRMYVKSERVVERESRVWLRRSRVDQWMVIMLRAES